MKKTTTNFRKLGVNLKKASMNYPQLPSPTLLNSATRQEYLLSPFLNTVLNVLVRAKRRMETKATKFNGKKRQKLFLFMDDICFRNKGQAQSYY